ncbi:MAG: hypothetical protein B7Z14_11745 [Bosea sp. 32-68-6]|nr:MAG: hypothetical protein B7Z14_11745 [Bosea sp. 32-68-6]
MTTLEALAATTPDGLVESRRPAISVLASLLRNPLQAMPPEVYRERLVLAKTGGRTSLYVCDPALILAIARAPTNNIKIMNNTFAGWFTINRLR